MDPFRAVFQLGGEDCPVGGAETENQIPPTQNKLVEPRRIKSYTKPRSAPPTLNTTPPIQEVPHQFMKCSTKWECNSTNPWNSPPNFFCLHQVLEYSTTWWSGSTTWWNGSTNMKRSLGHACSSTEVCILFLSIEFSWIKSIFSFKKSPPIWPSYPIFKIWSTNHFGELGNWGKFGGDLVEIGWGNSVFY